MVETTVSGRKVDNRSIRIVDMFPKQSSLNVNDLRMTSNAFSFKGLLKLLSGFGLSSNYERNRERYSQFVQQELYSSSFGKGAREFGWTFNPMPGTKRVASGARTTFAVMIVPKDTTGVFLRSKGCYFSRSAQEPQNFADTDWLSKMSDDKRGCSAERTFYIEIPDAGNREFFATAIKYSSVGKG
ncbi:MAG: hypothetical protein IPK58_10645 [Acidobacteria bacterium]|nr:hypothetical protein [Acidobacteriota bacterium]